MKRTLAKMRVELVEKGLFGLSKKILTTIFQRTLRRWWYADYWIIGKIFELKGSIFYVDGLKYSAIGPKLTTKFKSGFLLHDYEKDERQAVKRFLDTDVPVIEFGAGFGVISCTINKKLANPKDHIVVEANPYLIAPLEKNRDVNGCKFTIINKAVGYDRDSISMYLQGNIGSSGTKYESGEKIQVATVTLGRILQSSGFKIANLVTDIEGTEFDIIDKELDVLKSKIKTIIAEFHPNVIGKDRFDAVLLKLKNIGFEPMHRKESVYVLKNNFLQS